MAQTLSHCAGLSEKVGDLSSLNCFLESEQNQAVTVVSLERSCDDSEQEDLTVPRSQRVRSLTDISTLRGINSDRSGNDYAARLMYASRPKVTAAQNSC